MNCNTTEKEWKEGVRCRGFQCGTCRGHWDKAIKLKEFQDQKESIEVHNRDHKLNVMSLNETSCLDNKCNNCESCKNLDVRQRRKDTWWDVELFRIVKGELPTDSDKLTKKDAKNYLDRFVFGDESYPDSSCDQKDMNKFAFHVFASTNLAYVKE